jgi:hypothetical protein
LAVYTNAPGYARTLLELGDGQTPVEDPEPEVRRLIGALLGPTAGHAAPMSDASWRHVIANGYAPERNIHLAAYFAPARPVERFGTRGRLILDAPGDASDPRTS